MTDEDYVIRCCNVQGTSSGQWSFNPKPFLEKNYDIFITQRIEWTPIKELLKIHPKIKKKAKVIYVIHETKLPRGAGGGSKSFPKVPGTFGKLFEKGVK